MNLHAGALVNLWFTFVGMHKLPEEGTYVIFCQASVAPPPVSTLEGIRRLAKAQANNIPGLFHFPHHNQSSSGGGGGGGGLPYVILCYVRVRDL